MCRSLREEVWSLRNAPDKILLKTPDRTAREGLGQSDEAEAGVRLRLGGVHDMFG